jgi:hypothetical protein
MNEAITIQFPLYRDEKGVPACNTEGGQCRFFATLGRHVKACECGPAVMLLQAGGSYRPHSRCMLWSGGTL